MFSSVKFCRLVEHDPRKNPLNFGTDLDQGADPLISLSLML